LAEFVRVLRRGGIGVVQLATRPLWTPKGLIWRVVPFRIIGWAQRRVLGYPAPMRMTAIREREAGAAVDRAGADVVAWISDPTYTEDWRNRRMVFRRR
jgi:hypothetical protein